MEGFHEPFFSTGTLDYRMGVAEKHFPFPIQACTAMLDGMHVRANAYESTHQSEPIHTLAEFHRETLLAEDLCEVDAPAGIAPNGIDLADRHELRAAKVTDLWLRRIGEAEKRAAKTVQDLAAGKKLWCLQCCLLTYFQGCMGQKCSPSDVRT